MTSSQSKPVLPTYGRHTPGPWVIREGANSHVFDGRLSPEVDEDKTIAFVDIDGPNARLIAAAPDLLEALNTSVAWIVELAESGDAGFWDAEKTPEVIQARAAIAKATGA